MGALPSVSMSPEKPLYDRMRVVSPGIRPSTAGIWPVRLVPMIASVLRLVRSLISNEYFQGGELGQVRRLGGMTLSLFHGLP